MREEKYNYNDMALTDEQAALFRSKSSPEPEQYIQVNDVRYTLDEFNRVGDFLLGWELTDDQQVVLEWLKKSCTSDDYTSPMLAIYKLYSSQQMAPPTLRLTKEQQFQVLAAFAEWDLKKWRAKDERIGRFGKRKRTIKKRNGRPSERSRH